MALGASAQIGELLEPFRHLRCVGGACYFGSLIYLDFGYTFPVTARFDRVVQMGLMTLSIRNQAWALVNQDGLLVSAADVSPERFTADVAPIITGLALRAIDVNEKAVSILFDDSTRVDISAVDLHENEEDALELAFPDGRLLIVDYSLRVQVDYDSNPDRSREWSSSPLRH